MLEASSAGCCCQLPGFNPRHAGWGLSHSPVQGCSGCCLLHMWGLCVVPGTGHMQGGERSWMHPGAGWWGRRWILRCAAGWLGVEWHGKVLEFFGLPEFVADVFRGCSGELPIPVNSAGCSSEPCIRELGESRISLIWNCQSLAFPSRQDKHRYVVYL